MSPQEIAALTNKLGTSGGIEEVYSRLELLNAELAQADHISKEEAHAMRAALAALSDAIIKMNRVVQTMLAAAGVSAEHVG